MSGADPITTILTAIEAVEAAITPPSGWSVPVVWTTLTADPGAFPAWLNVVDSEDSIIRASSTRTSRINIKAYLVFASAEYAYASTEQRAWVPLIKDAFDQHLTLSGSVQLIEVNRIDYGPIDINGVPFVAITFELEATVSEPFAFS